MGHSQGTPQDTQQHAPDTGQQPPAPGDDGPPPFWEWVAAGIGLVLVLACLGYLAVEALREATPPDPAIDLVAVHRQGSRYLAVVRVVNRGRVTAGALKVTGELRQGAQVLERSETEFEFVPGGSSREAGLFFSRDPRAFELALRAQSYQAP